MAWRHPLAILIALLVSGGAFVPAQEIAPVAQMARSGDERPATRIRGSAHVLNRADDGLFYLVTPIQGVPVRFIVDTGANVTVLSAADARRIDWREGQIEGAATLATAGGNTAMRWAHLDTISIGDHDVDGIDAALPRSGSPTSLLGQDVLSRLGSVTQRGDRLVIE